MVQGISRTKCIHDHINRPDPRGDESPPELSPVTHLISLRGVCFAEFIHPYASVHRTLYGLCPHSRMRFLKYTCVFTIML